MNTRIWFHALLLSAAIGVEGEQVVFNLDLSPFPRTPAPTETLTYNPAWGNGSSVTIALDGETIGTYNAAGETLLDTTGWTYGIHTLTHTSGGETMTAKFNNPFPPTEVLNLTARQRYPWNGLVDIECDIVYLDTNAWLKVSMVATNTVTGAALPVRTVHVADGVGITVKTGAQHFIWDAGADAPNVKIDDVALTVDAEIWLGGVQLWEGGPYWAECNVGATKPEEYGYYFWWGDTTGYKRNAGNNGWVSVKDGASYSFGNCPTYEKSYTKLRSEGWIDASGNLAAAHDAAMAHLGAPWRMPTDAEWDALISNCTTTWMTSNGVSGRLVTGKGAYASKSIFIPAAGSGYGSFLYYPGSYGYYWSSTPDSDNSDGAWYLDFGSGYFGRDYYDRYGGQSVRPLRGFAQ